MLDTCLARNVLCSLFIVTCEHYHIQIHGTQFLYSNSRICLQNICSRNNTKISSGFCREIERCFSFCIQFIENRYINLDLLHQFSITAEISYTIDYSRYTLTRQGLEFGDRRKNQISGFFHNRLGEGMLRLLFQRGSNRYQLISSNATRNYIRDSGFTYCKSASFIQYDRIHMMEILESLGIFKEHTHSRSPAGSHHDCNGCSQAKCTRTGNNKHRNGIGKRKVECFTQKHPYCKCNNSNTHDSRNKDARDFVCKTRNGGFGTTCFFY